MNDLIKSAIQLAGNVTMVQLMVSQNFLESKIKSRVIAAFKPDCKHPMKWAHGMVKEIKRHMDKTEGHQPLQPVYIDDENHLRVLVHHHTVNGKRVDVSLDYISIGKVQRSGE